MIAKKRRYVPRIDRGRYQIMERPFFDALYVPKNSIFFGDASSFYHGGRSCQNTDFVNCYYPWVVFGGKFSNVTFTNCDLPGASMEHALLTRVAFTDCTLATTSFSGAYLDRVHLSQGTEHVCLAGALWSSRSPLPRGYVRAVRASQPLPPYKVSLIARARARLVSLLHPTTYNVLDYDLADLPTAAAALIAEHPGISTANLHALCRALSPTPGVPSYVS